jgi:arylsulfatase A-like enzyme
MKPNIVMIITDNQSPWTLGCYGNEEILTPNIDRLAAEGVRFTNAFCSNPVCSPNRATLLTGLMPSQHGVHNWLGTEKPDAQMGPHAYCTIREFVTLPWTLADEGYDCGMCGKWHLGDSLHPQLGFRYWFAMPKGHTRSFYDAEAIWEGKVYRESRYYLDAITDHAIDFMRQARNPFFLYVGYNGPYGLDQDLRTGHRNRHTAYYADKELRCFPREEAHPWLRQNLDCIGNETAMRSYACAVSGVDDGVGAILEALAELGYEEDTLVVFTADHGLCAGHHGMWGMGDHSRPLHMFQTNLRVPLIFRHPARIKAGQVVEIMTCNYDFLPSVLSYLELDEHIPVGVPLPGRSYAPALVGQELEWDEEIIFHEYENTRAVQTRRWKLVQRHPDGPDELYDLLDDPGERRNLIDEPDHADIRASLRTRLQDFFRRYADPQYDLWREGRSKAGRILER